ncbi:MAG TPA: peptidase [Planctomycetaceae bacterium]|nr:peptidase [Planctomycetaceae bacterium]
MSMLHRFFCFGLFSLAIAGSLQAASPRLNVISPRGVQRGGEHELTFTGSNLGDAKDVMFYDSGFEVLEVTGEGNNAKVKVRVAADCRLGEHVAQVRTASGISDYRTLYVEDLPVVQEVEPNSEFTAPQAIALNTVVNGTIGSEDVDYYVIEAKQGQRISAEIVAMRLSTAMFDPYVAILDEKRFELDTNDDTALALQDGFVSIVAPADGKYYIEVRESAYANGSTYRMHVGTFPRPKSTFPAGGKLGETVEVQFLGLPSGELKQSVSLPPKPVTDFGVFAQDDQGISPTPNTFRLFEHGNAFEAEPNNEIAQATPVELPLAMNGIIESDGDIDCFTFAAKKGAVYEVECYARRIRSELDPVMNIYYADGRSIAGNDDSRGPDSYLRFTVPEDGNYTIRITDHLGRGGPEFVYRVEFQSVVPALTLGIPRNERYGQYRQQIYVPKGNRFGTIISANRMNFGGELALLGENLPPGITMHCEPMPANQNVMPVVFEATADAELNGALVDFLAKHTDPNQNIQGGYVNRADYLVAAPGQSLYRWKDVDRLAMAVIEEVPFHIEIVEPLVPLVREGSLKLKIVATKREGWDEEIAVQFPYRSPGVNAPPSVSIPKGQTEVFYELNAAGNAEIKSWKVFALASSQGMWAASKLTSLDIADAPVKFELQRTACEQGQEALVLCKINHATPFEGDAKAELVGIPPKVTVEAVSFNKETQEVTFTLKTATDSPVGKHGLYCNLVIPHNGDFINSRGGTVEFQIDQPLPPAANATPAPMPVAQAAAPAAAAPAAATPPPPPKPLTRLEKLRLAAQERQKADSGQ